MGSCKEANVGVGRSPRYEVPWEDGRGSMEECRWEQAACPKFSSAPRDTLEVHCVPMVNLTLQESSGSLRVSPLLQDRHNEPLVQGLEILYNVLTHSVIEQRMYEWKQQLGEIDAQKT